MMKGRRVFGSRETALAGLFICLGLVIPYFTSHMFGIKGTVLLPMHFPVLVAGFVCGPLAGLAVGVLTPLLSFLLTGMPPLYPVLPGMMCELAVYGSLTGFLYRVKRRGIFFSLVVPMAVGRLVQGAVVSLLLFAGSGVWGAGAFLSLLKGVPGTLLQLLIIPPLVRALTGSGAAAAEPAAEKEAVPGAVRRCLEEIKAGQISLAVIRGGEVVRTEKGRGAAPLLKILDEDAALLKGAVVVDRIVGKAAAMLLTLGGAESVYTPTVSLSGKQYLEERGIALHAERCIDVVSNGARDGICPLERAVREIEDPEEGRRVLRETLQKLAEAAAKDAV